MTCSIITHHRLSKEGDVPHFAANHVPKSCWRVNKNYLSTKTRQTIPWDFEKEDQVVSTISRSYQPDAVAWGSTIDLREKVFFTQVEQT